MCWQSLAQYSGNEWINYDQKYFRFAVARDGLCRLTFEDLQSVVHDFGIQLENIPPANFQVWSRGQQLYLDVCLGQDAIFNTGDYIDFYAQRNDGWLDEKMYPNPSDQVNRDYSLFNDTIFCFFSWNASGNNPRFTRVTNTNFSAYSPISYVTKTKKYVFHDAYLEGERYNTSDPNVTIGYAGYTPGEGYSGNKIWVNQNQTRALSLDGFFPPGPDTRLTFTVTGGSNRELTVNQHHLQVNIGTTSLVDTLYAYNLPITFSRSISPDLLTGGSANMVFSHIGIGGQILQEWESVSNITAIYPRIMDFTGSDADDFEISSNGTPAYSYIRLTGLSVSTGDSVLLIDLNNHNLMRTVYEDGIVKSLVPNLPGAEKCYFSKSSAITIVQKIVPVEPSSARFIPYHSYVGSQNIDYLVLTSSQLRPAADQYAQYRIVNGFPNTYRTLVVDIDQLYDQFAYGIPKHPLAIRNFLVGLIEDYPGQIKYLLMLGKAFQARDYRNDINYYKNTLVPTWGYPPSDLLFTLGLSNPNELAIPVGRLSASFPENVIDYLEKVHDFESDQQAPSAALKNVVQFGGGGGFLEQILFKNYLMEYDSVLRSPYFGARTFNFFKQSSSPDEINQSEYLHDLLENMGVSIINYFAHASGISFDYSLGDPANFNNEGKYYFVTANSCWAGDIFNYHGGLSSERYVLLPNKGAIGYLASVTEGESPYLHTYSEKFFSHLSLDMYGKPIGDIIANTVKDILQDTNLNNFSYKETSYEMILHGDPALVINSPPYPDYDMTASAVVPERILFQPAEITDELDSFNVIVIHSNLGKALDTNYFIRIQRSVLGEVITDTLLRIKAPLNQDSFIISMPLLRSKGTGLNTFTVTVDPFNEIDEAGREFNNVAERKVNIQSYDVIPILPEEFAVVPDTQLNLTVSTSDPFASSQSYLFQLDTLPTFDSPIYTDTVITHSGGIVSWKVNLPLSLDSVVYFWRCRRETDIPVPSPWRNSSFQYLQGKRGWSQAHFLQMENNEYHYVHYLKDSLKFIFTQDIKNLVAQTYGINHPWQEENFKINNKVMDTWSCAHTGCQGNSGFKLAVFNPTSFEPWYSYDTLNGIGPWGNRHCKAYPTPSFDFCNSDSAGRQLITTFINAVPQDYYVLAMTHKNSNAGLFEEPLYQAFESLGSGTIRQLADTSSYILFGKKGLTPGQAVETGLNSSRDSLLRLTAVVPTDWNQGRITSSRIGPAASWHSIHWHTICEETDSVGMMVMGVRSAGETDTLLRDIPADSMDLFHLESLIPAKIYPYLILSVIMKDKSGNPADPPTPAILKHWQVFYDGLPETAIDPASGFNFYRDSVQEGDSVRLKLAFHNISEMNMDSLLVVYYLDNHSLTDTLLKKRLRNHPAHDILVDSLVLSTIGREGNNTLWVEVNPYKDQKELTHCNNLGELPFVVVKDMTDPILDVTFDGQHILDYDFVSPQVTIVVALTDENPFLKLSDTTVIQLWLTYENENEKMLYYRVDGKDQLFFKLLPGEQNICQVVFPYQYLKEGVYMLRVAAVDKSGNSAGVEDYTLHFTVSFNSMQTEVLAIPNPFRDFTRFAFVLSGSCVPSGINITISDITGKIVKIFNQYEFGPLHIGTNFSEKIWDGRDSRGNNLANGVYVYKVAFTYPCSAPEMLNDYKGKYYYFTASEHGKIILMK